MDFQDVNSRGLVMLGCGKMGSAMLEGWLSRGLSASAVHILDPNPSPWLQGAGASVNGALPQDPAVLMIAVKPQMMAEALPRVATAVGPNTLLLTVAAGTPIATYEATFGADTRIVRSMPNTPAAIGKGITAIVGNAAAGAGDLDLAEALLSAIGAVVRLSDEADIDAVTGVSGSGPAYVFYMIEAMTEAAQAQGLSEDLAKRLALATVAGAGALAEQATDNPAQLRRNVTSPNGTTQAGLEVLMDAETGLAPLMRRTVKAAADRSRALKG